MHSLSANRLLLISAPSCRVLASAAMVSAPRSEPAPQWNHCVVPPRVKVSDADVNATAVQLWIQPRHQMPPAFPLTITPVLGQTCALSLRSSSLCLTHTWQWCWICCVACSSCVRIAVPCLPLAVWLITLKDTLCSLSQHSLLTRTHTHSHLTNAPARSMSDSLREQPLELPAPAARAVTSDIWKMECDLDDVSLADVLPVVLRRRRPHPPPSAPRSLLLLSALRLCPVESKPQPTQAHVKCRAGSHRARVPLSMAASTSHVFLTRCSTIPNTFTSPLPSSNTFSGLRPASKS
jgi:hypothetical protein